MRMFFALTILSVRDAIFVMLRLAKTVAMLSKITRILKLAFARNALNLAQLQAISIAT
jgi:hypothetical protein